MGFKRRLFSWTGRGRREEEKKKEEEKDEEPPL
jgi:hypothetical protein